MKEFYVKLYKLSVPQTQKSTKNQCTGTLNQSLYNCWKLCYFSLMSPSNVGNNGTCAHLLVRQEMVHPRMTKVFFSKKHDVTCVLCTLVEISLFQSDVLFSMHEWIFLVFTLKFSQIFSHQMIQNHSSNFEFSRCFCDKV